MIGPIRSTVKEPGFYLYPGMDMSGKASESEQQAWPEKAKQGPVGVLIVQPQGSEFVMLHSAVTELGTNIVSALLAALLLAQVRSGRLLERVGFVTLLGVLAFVTIIVPYWNWYSFPDAFVAGEAIDHAPAGSSRAWCWRRSSGRPRARSPRRVERHFDGVRGDANDPHHPHPAFFSAGFASSADVWSCTIFQPSGSLRKMTVNRPPGVVPSGMVSCQRPRASTASGPSGSTSSAENASRPIARPSAW